MTPRGGVMAGARGRVVLRRQLRRRSGHGGRAGHANLAGVSSGGVEQLLPAPPFYLLHAAPNPSESPSCCSIQSLSSTHRKAAVARQLLFTKSLPHPIEKLFYIYYST
jgi:hypothetical protein